MNTDTNDDENAKSEKQELTEADINHLATADNTNSADLASTEAEGNRRCAA